MTRYERTQEAIRSVEHHAPSLDEARDLRRGLLLVADVPDHRDPSGVVHVDAARAALDWFCKRHPNHPICLASAARQNTRKAWEAFGYVHLPKEYPRLRLLDLNVEPLPQASLTMHLTTGDSSPWGAYLARPQRMYTPRGHVWRRDVTIGEATLASSPSLGEVPAPFSKRCGGRGILEKEPHLTVVVQ